MAPLDLTKPISYTAFHNRPVLITGAASGLGAAFATSLATHGAHVLLADLNAPAGQSLAASLSAAGHTATFLPVDVADWSSQLALFRAAMAATANQPLALVVTAAGIAGGVPLRAEPPAALDAAAAGTHEGAAAQQRETRRIVEVDLLGTLYTAKLAAQYAMGAHEGGGLGVRSVLLVASLAGYGPISMAPDYGAAKYGVRGAFQSLRAGLEALGVRVNLLAPFFVKTAMTAGMVGGLEERGARLARLEDAVEAVWRVAGDESVQGRAVAVTADGLVDLRDDVEGGGGGAVMGGFARDGTLWKKKGEAQG